MAARKPPTITVDVDGRTAAWTPLDPPLRHPLGLRRLAAVRPDVRRLLAHTGGRVAGGVLVGDMELAAVIADVLGPWSRVDSVTVAQPGVTVTFSGGRDSAADVAAAMIHAGAGRSRLSDSGWEALEPLIADQLGEVGDAVVH
jgi:hypothetical protein